jgi:glycosyltransferase involved in cell wall biosynthesis
MISAVIPAFNESSAIEGTIASVFRVLNELGLPDAEVIVVDDGSADDTSEKSRLAGALVVRHPHNLGYGRSLKDGIAAARNDCIVIIDADLTYPAESIPVILNEYRKGFDMVVGARTGAHYSESVIKSPLRSILQLLIEFTTGRKVPDVNSGLRVFSRAAVMEHFDHLCDTFSFTTSMTLAYMMTGRFVTYVPIGYNSRVGRSKVRLLRDTLRTLQYILEALVFYNPLKVFLLLAIGCLALCLLSAIIGSLASWPVLLFLSAGSFLMSVQMLALGIFATMLRQIHRDRNRSALAERSTLNFSVEAVRPAANSLDGQLLAVDRSAGKVESSNSIYKSVD